MFHTFAPAEVPFPPGMTQEGRKHWWYVEYCLFLPWFHVTYEITEPDNDFKFTLMRLFMQVEHFVEFSKWDDVIIKEPSIVTPKYMNGISEWRMDPLKEIWQANSPDRPKDILHIYVLKDGKLYQDRDKNYPEDTLLNKKLIYKLNPV